MKYVDAAICAFLVYVARVSDLLRNRRIQKLLAFGLVSSLLVGSCFIRRSTYHRKLRTLKKINGGGARPQIDKAIVLAKTRNDDISWVLDVAAEWTPYIYTTSWRAETGFLVPPTTRGHEAVAYLHYILTHYDNLPEYVAFVRASSDPSHNDILGHTADVLRNLRLDSVTRQGYLNFRCSHIPGCPISVEPHEPSESDLAKKHIRAFFADAYRELFGADDVPNKIGQPCGTQFAVTRERILQRSRADYQRMLWWAKETKLTDSDGVGWVFEKVWHIVFGKEPVHCPPFEQCRCDLFGWCGPPKLLPEEHGSLVKKNVSEAWD